MAQQGAWNGDGLRDRSIILLQNTAFLPCLHEPDQSPALPLPHPVRKFARSLLPLGPHLGRGAEAGDVPYWRGWIPPRCADIERDQPFGRAALAPGPVCTSVARRPTGSIRERGNAHEHRSAA